MPIVTWGIEWQRCAYRLTASPGDGFIGTGTTGLFGPRGNNSGRFAN